MKVILLILSSVALNAFAQNLTYPELNVVPRASQRVKLEIKNESRDAWSSNLAVQISSLSTLSAGIMASSSVDTDKDENKLSPVIAMSVGGAWLSATAWAAMKYRPYKESFKRIRKLPYKTKRERLIVERLAEEEINTLRSLGKRIRWFSTFSNLAASTYLLESVEGDSDAHMAASVSALLALGPLFFNYKWENIAKEQEKYKKKIYTPVAVSPIFQSPFKEKARVAGISLLYTY